MSIALLFWIIYIVYIVLGFAGYGAPIPANYWGYGRHIVIVILIGLLGWHVFGPAIHN